MSGRLPDWWRRKPDHLPGQGGGTVTEAPATPPAPLVRRRDWLDDILDDHSEPEPEPEPELDPESEPEQGDESAPRQRGTRLWLAKGTQGQADQHPATVLPRSSLLAALDGVPPRVRRLIANSAAAYLGWTVGLLDFAEDAIAWVHTEGLADPQSIFWVLVGIACLALYRRSCDWWWPVAWLASVPAATAVAGVLLYAPTS